MTQQQPVPAAEAKKRVIEWFFHPRTPELAWKELSWRQIGDACRVSHLQARRYLPPLVKKKYGFTLQELNNIRNVSAIVQHRKGVKRPDTEIEEMRKARETMTVEEVADKFGVSTKTVLRHTRKKQE